MPYFQDSNGSIHFLTGMDIASGYEHLLPDGCTPITDAQAEAIQHPPITLDTAQTAALSAIDAAAGAARARYITTVAGQAETYLRKEDQARAYKLAGYPSTSTVAYPLVLAEAQAIYGSTPTSTQIKAAADGIISQADDWMAKAMEIERVRRVGKIAVSSATSVAAVNAAQDASVAGLAAV